MKKIVCGLIAAAGFLAAANGAMADSHGDDKAKMDIKYRQAIFTAMKWNFGPLVGMAKGEVDYDPEKAGLLADQLHALSFMAPQGFAKGTEGGDAKPEIWQDMDKFSAGMKALEDATGALAEASGDKAAMGEAVANVGKICKGCHENFRKD